MCKGDDVCAQIVDVNRVELARLGAVEVIMKPFEFEQLAGAVRRALTL